MSNRILREGMPHQIKRLQDGGFGMIISIPKDPGGRVARECPDEKCSPGYFKVTPATATATATATARAAGGSAVQSTGAGTLDDAAVLTIRRAPYPVPDAVQISWQGA